MVETVSTRSAGIEAFGKLYAELARERASIEPAWLGERRREAFARFERLGLPTRKDEAWRSTSISPLVRGDFARPSAPATGELDGAANLIEQTWERDVARIVLVDGFPAATLARPTTERAVELRSLSEAARAGSARVAELLGTIAAEGSGPFVQLNGALFGDGAFVHVPRGLALDRPIEIVHVVTAGARPAAIHSRTLIVLEEGARASVVERFVGLAGARSWTNAVTEVLLAPNASLERVVLEEGAAESFHLSTTRVRLDRGARLKSSVVTLGANLARDEVHVDLAGEGSECELAGLYVGHGTRQVDCRTFVDHACVHGTSTQDYRGILDGRSRGAFGGGVLVREGAQKTNARQSNRNILLSHDASADTKPGLTILADDVQCSHGATVGELDEQEVFYLRSRGLDEATARALLVLGFARGITEGIGRRDLRRYAEERAIGLLAGSITLLADLEATT
jgi:Fe-S cluster assembly protein SufD